MRKSDRLQPDGLRSGGSPSATPRNSTDNATAGADRRAVVQSVSRAIDLLHLLRDAGTPLPAADIANVMGLDRTIVYRLLRTLAQRSMISETDGLFALGPSSVLLGQRYLDNLPLRRFALPYMVDLQTKVLQDRPWTLALTMLVQNTSTVIERMWTPLTPLGLVLDLGDTLPLHRTAAGRSMLAYLGAADVRTILSGGSEDLLPVLEQIRAAGGVALADGSTTNGLQAVACCIRRTDGAQPVAAIGVGGVDLGRELAYDSMLATQLRHAADAISRLIR